MYPAKVLERCQGGTRAGSLPAGEPGVASASVRAPRHGDLIRLQVRTDRDRIREARFKSFGCGWTIASASLAAEWIEGRTAEEALALTPGQIAAELELPDEKAHSAILAVEAVRAVVAAWRRLPG